MPFFTPSCTDSCLLALPAALLPSALWLAAFALSSVHRERFVDIMRVALGGILLAVPVVIAELIFQQIFVGNGSLPPTPIGSFLYLYVGIAFVEEYAKYGLVRIVAMGRPFFNQPQDAILYLVAAAIGFAAIENTIYVASIATSATEALLVALQRGLTATALHVAASASLGYFLALSLRADAARERFKLVAVGLLFATVLHGLYNTLIINIERTVTAHAGAGASMAFSWILVALLLSTSLAIVISAFKSLARR